MSTYNPTRKARKTSVVADILGCVQMTVRRLIEAGELDGYRIGRNYYVYMDSVHKYRSKQNISTAGIDN